MKYLITLVNGTFAKDAPWTRSDSDFCKKLNEHLGVGHEVAYFQYSWNGKNTHEDRIRAGERLSSMLAEQVKRTDCKKIIIGHSHGGNVAMYALKKLGDNSGYFDLVTMATPFLNVSRRRMTDDLTVQKFIIPGFLGFIAVILYGLAIFEFAPRLHLPPEYADWLLIAAMGIGMYVFLGTIGSCYRFINHKSAYFPDVVADFLSKAQIDVEQSKYNILALIDHSDEVRLWFNGLYRIWELLLNVYDLASRITPWLIGFGLLWLSVVMTCFKNVPPGSKEEMWLMLPYYAGILIAFGTFAMSFILPVLFIFIRSNPLILGWENFTYRMFVRTNPTITPIGYKNLNLIQYELKKNSLISLNHSIYEHEKVIQNMSEWIKTTAGR